MSLTSKDLFQSVEKYRLSDEVAKQIERIIAEGRFAVGERLPSERVLSKKLEVSRPVLREALRILELQGIVRIQHGSGVFVKDPSTDMSNVSLAHWLHENKHLLEEYYEARLVIEPECAALASQRGTDEEIVALRELIQRLDQAVEEKQIAASVGMDIDFHSSIAEMAGNSLLSQMLSSIINLETDMRKIVLRLPGHFPHAQEKHTKILEAIERRDPEAARQAMIEALQGALIAIGEFMKQQEDI